MSEAATKIADAYDVHCGDPMRPEWRTELAEKIDAAIAAAVRQEREACEQACRDIVDYGDSPAASERAGFITGQIVMRTKCAAAIRARNKETPDAKA